MVGPRRKLASRVSGPRLSFVRAALCFFLMSQDQSETGWDAGFHSQVLRLPLIDSMAEKKPLS
jgi:hypothetical protein